MPDNPRGLDEGPDIDAPRPNEDVASPARGDVTEFTTAGVAPEARADRVPPDVDQNAPPSEPEPSGVPYAREPAARKTAVPGIGGGQAPPPEYGESPKMRLSRPLATHQPEPKIGDAPVAPYRRGEDDE